MTSGDPAIPLLGIYPKKTKTLIWKCVCTVKFLRTAAKIRKQPKCPSRDEWIKNMWYVYTIKHYSGIKNKIFPFVASWLDTEDIMLKWNKSHRERQILYYLTYINVWNLEETKQNKMETDS